jgi:ankyrin repeat protein
MINPTANLVGSSALHYAVLINDVEIVRELLKANADPHIQVCLPSFLTFLTGFRTIRAMHLLIIAPATK